MSRRAVTPEFEARLARAFTPVDPPADLDERLEARLSALVDLATDELEKWELSAMRDPRNWAPTVAAATVGGAAAVGLVVLRTHQRRGRRGEPVSDAVDLVTGTVADLGREAGKLAGQARRRLS